jgi:hypothetical protein
VASSSRARARAGWSNAAPIQSVAITAPAGLSFSHNREQLARGLPNLATSAGKYAVTVKRNRLILTFTYPGNRIPLTIAVPALKESAGLIKKKSPKMSIGLRVIDAAGRHTALVMTTNVK